MGYKANVVVNPTANGYRTTLIAMNENCLFEIHLVLKDYLFHEQSKVYVRCFNTKTNQDWEIEQDVVYSNEFNERKDIVMSIIENKYKPELIYSFYNMFKDMHYDRMCIDNVGRQWNRRKKYYKPRKNLYVAF